MASLLAGHFRAALSRGLAVAARRWAAGGAAEERDRLAPVVEALSQRCGPANKANPNPTLPLHWAAGGAAEERGRLAPVVEALSQRRGPALPDPQPCA